MKTRTILLTLLAMLTWSLAPARADETITVTATGQDISESLDLRAVATLFGEVDNLEQFEEELNSEKRHLNNLDLNGDGYVDYLRVIEVGEGENRLIVLQAVLAKDIYQDVASIYVEREQDQTVSVQVVGDTYLYGENYIIEPVYLYRPVIYDWFWGPAWVAWHSPYYWGYYSPYYTFYAPWHWDVYYHHIYAFHHHHPRCSYHYAHVPRPGMGTLRGSHSAERIIRNDWAKSHPDHSFTARASLRGSQATNARQLQRETRSTAAARTSGGPASRTSSAPSTTGTRLSRSASEARESAAARTFGSANTRASAGGVGVRASGTGSATRSSAATQGVTRASASSQSNTGVRASASGNTNGTRLSGRDAVRQNATTSTGTTPRASASSQSSTGVRTNTSTGITRSSGTTATRSSGGSTGVRMPSSSSSAGTYRAPSSSSGSIGVRSSSSGTGVRSSGGGSSSGGSRGGRR